MPQSNNIWYWAFSIGSAIGTAAVLYALLPLWLAGIILAVIVAHELGHMGAGFFVGAETYPPIFIPIGILVVGLTKTKIDDPKLQQFIALAGPFAGVLVALAVLVIGFIFGLKHIVIAAGSVLFWELYGATFGSDGRKYRKSKRQANLRIL